MTRAFDATDTRLNHEVPLSSNNASRLACSWLLLALLGPSCLLHIADNSLSDEPHGGTRDGGAGNDSMRSGSERDAVATCFSGNAVCADPHSSTGWAACANGGRCVVGLDETPGLCCPVDSANCAMYSGCAPRTEDCPIRATRCRTMANLNSGSLCNRVNAAGEFVRGTGVSCGSAGTEALVCPPGYECGASMSNTYSALDDAARNPGYTVPWNPAFYCFPAGNFAARTLTEMSNVNPAAIPRDQRIPSIDHATGCVIGQPSGDVYPGTPVNGSLNGCPPDRSISCYGGCIPIGRICCGSYSCNAGDSCAEQGYCRRGGNAPSMGSQCEGRAIDLSLDCGTRYRCGGEGCCPVTTPYFCRGVCYRTPESASAVCGTGACIVCR